MYHQQSCHYKGGCGSGYRGHWGRHAGGQWGAGWARTIIPVNINETDSSFEIQVLAPGRSREEFKISVQDDVLTISYQKKEEEKTDANAHHEFRLGSFERSFKLNGKVLTGQISAEYKEGILYVTLPKNPETNKPAQEVNVS